MYKVVMTPSTPRAWKNSFLSLPGSSTPLGKITMGGSILHGKGTGQGRWRILGEWAFVYLVEGEGLYEDVLGQRQSLQPGNWILVFPELGHRYGPLPGGSWNELYVSFTGPLFEQWRKAGILDATRSVGSLTPVFFWCKEMARVMGHMEDPALSALEVLTLWQHWLGRVMTEQGWPGDESVQWIAQACRFLEQALALPDPAGRKVAKQMGMGYENFRKKFSLHLGVSPGRYREQLRIEKAKQLLRSKRITNKELAEMLGFCDEAHFSKSFLRVAGISPRQFARGKKL